MYLHPRLRTAALLVAALTAPLSSASADIVVLFNGKWYEGVIKQEHHDRIVIDTLVSGIRTDLTIDRTTITSIQKRPLSDGFFESGGGVGGTTAKDPAPGPAPSDPAAADPANPAVLPNDRPSGPTYAVIPIAGEFGKDVYPVAIAAILAECRQRGIQHVILRINSKGGAVWVAEEILRLLQTDAGPMRIHAVVEDAVSAAIWPVFASETIWVLPGASIGAAVVYRRELSTGAAEVDAKLNSAIAAALAGAAERRGHPAVLARAMILPEAAVYRYVEDGRTVLTADRPVGRPGVTVIDNDRSVLTLTAGDAVEVGLARAIDAFDPEALREALGLESWSAADVPVESLIRRYTQSCRNLSEQMEKLAEELVERVRSAHGYDPYGHTYKVTPEGRFTPDSQRRWQELSGKCQDEWTRVRALLVRFNGLQKKADELRLLPLAELIAKDRIRTSIEEIDDKLSMLKKERSIGRPPAEFERR